MTNKTENEPAFPLFLPGTDNHKDWWTPGMTLRDWFAGQALNGMLSNYHLIDSIKKHGDHQLNNGMSIELVAYEISDEMLEMKKITEELEEDKK